MITSIGAQELEDRIRRRIEGGSGTFSSGEILDAAKSALNRLYTKMRLSSQYHDTEVIVLTISDLTIVPGRQFVYEYVLPETVGELVFVEGYCGGGVRAEPIPNLAPQLAGNAYGVCWHWLGARPGIIRIVGQINRYSSIALTVVRTWAPLHYGTAAGAAAQTLTFAAAPTAGKLVRRDNVYAGMDVLITSDTVPGAIDQIRRVASYVGSTRVATMTQPWTVVPSGCTYSLVPPLPAEHEELLIEEAAQILKEELAEPLPVSPRLGMLREDFEDALSRRDGEPTRIYNRGI